MGSHPQHCQLQSHPTAARCILAKKNISVKPLVSQKYGCRELTVLLQKPCCCRKSSDTVTGLHTEKAENTKTTSNFHPPTPLLISKLKSYSEPNFTESLDNVGFSFLPLQYESLIECLLPISTTIPSVQFSHSVVSSSFTIMLKPWVTHQKLQSPKSLCFTVTQLHLLSDS